MFESKMLLSGLILIIVFLVFTVGKSPVFRLDRAGAAIVGATLTVALGILSFDQASLAVDFRTIILLFSMMIVTANLKLSGFFQLAGNYLLKKVHTKKALLFAVIMTSGILSAFFINDIVCLLFTPVVIGICHQAGVKPLPFLIGTATASNIGSAGTLIGNPQNILIGSLSHLPFSSYLVSAFPFALFGLVINYLFISRLYRKDLAGELPSVTPSNGHHHTYYLMTKSLATTILILAGFILGGDPVIVSSLGASYLLLTRRIKPNRIYTSIDFNLLVIFAGLFVVIGGVENSGLINWLMHQMHLDKITSFPVFTVATITFSNIVSNVPAVMLLKFLIPGQNPDIWWTSLGIFSTIAGNLTLTGSVANLIVVEIAKRNHIRVGFLDYLKVGFPLTVFLTACGLAYFYLFLWS
jgi:Na+/H+ antiporter NhaD/arsenite permease-like protein